MAIRVPSSRCDWDETEHKPVPIKPYYGPLAIAFRSGWWFGAVLLLFSFACAVALVFGFVLFEWLHVTRTYCDVDGKAMPSSKVGLALWVIGTAACCLVSAFYALCNLFDHLVAGEVR